MKDLLISAGHATRRGDILDLRGDVQIIFNGQHLIADHVIVNTKSKVFFAYGGVSIQSLTEKITGERVIWNYRTNTGTITDGYIESGQMYFEGRTIEKLSKNQFYATDANFTNCTTCPPAWGFSGSKITATQGEYARIHNSVIRMGGLPVLWLPYLVVPIKSKRQSGFLPPTYDYQQQAGNIFGESYFWAIARNQDATISEKWLQKRGWKTNLQYRYVLSKNSAGTMNAGFIRDSQFPATIRTQHPNAGSAFDRWFVNYQHYFQLPDGFVQRASINYTDDLHYPIDFVGDLPNPGDPALENRISLTHNTDRNHLSLDSDYYINMLQYDPLTSNNNTVQRLPSIRYSHTDSRLFGTNLIYSFDFRYDNFVRQTRSYDVIESCNSNSGYPIEKQGISKIPPYCIDTSNNLPAFDPNQDLIRTGQRAIFAPTMYYPIHLGRFVNLVPSVTFKHIQYSFNTDPQTGSSFDQSPYREYVRARLTASTEFSGVFGDLKNPKGVRYRHSFEPEIFSSSVPWLSQTNDPRFFGTLNNIPAYEDENPITNTDFFDLDDPNAPANSGLQFDYFDRLYDRNVLGINLINTLTRKTWAGDLPVYRRIALLRVSELYDLNEAKKPAGQGRPWSDVRTLLDVRLHNFETNTLVSYFPYHHVADTDARVTFYHGPEFITTNYSEAFTITQATTVPAFSATHQQTLGLSVGWQSNYLNIAAGAQYSLLKSRWFKTPLSWTATLDAQPPGHCLILHLGVTQPDTSSGVSPTFQFAFRMRFGGGGAS